MRWFTIPYPSTNGMHYAPNIDNPYFLQEGMGNIVLIIITNDNIIILNLQLMIDVPFLLVFMKSIENNFEAHYGAANFHEPSDNCVNQNKALTTSFWSR